MLGAFRACPAPRLWLLNGRDARSPSAPRFCPCLGGTTPPRWRLSIRSQQVATLPWFWAGGGLVFAAQSRHEEPYPPMSKINPTIPFTIPFKGMQGKYTPFPRRFQAGNAFLEVCRRIDPTQVAKTGQTCFRAFINSQWDCVRGSSSGVRGRAPPRWRLSMRRSQGDRVTIGHSKLRPSRWPRQARPLPL